MRATFIALIGTMLGVGTALAEDNSACAVAARPIRKVPPAMISALPLLEFPPFPPLRQ